MYLRDVSLLLFGKTYNNDETQCMIMLTHTLSALRKLKLTIDGETITGELDESLEAVQDTSIDVAEITAEE